MTTLTVPKQSSVPISPASVDSKTATLLPRDSNQARGIGEFAIEFMRGRLGSPSQAVLDRTIMFHTDSVLCGLSAIALGTNAPNLLRQEAFEYERTAGSGLPGVPVFGSARRVAPEKAVAANCAAVREWDSNGTNFGYNPRLNHTAGEFGHNDFYPVAIAAAQLAKKDGTFALRGMVLIDEIRGRLAEVFSLKSHKIDHVVHGAIASAAAYGAMLGATAEHIESAIGMLVAHYIPWRAIRAGKQLSDSKGASAALSTEAAVLSMQRSMRGFIGPKDIFRNPEAIFRFFQPTTSGKERWAEIAPSPFDLVLSHSGDDFAVMGMHFKLGLYEHQSAGALQGMIELLARHPEILNDPSGDSIREIRILAYEPAFGIIGNPAKMDPHTRQSADHSMAYIVATLLRKALQRAKPTVGSPIGLATRSSDQIWKSLMLSPDDYREDETAIFDPRTRALMKKVKFEHGGPEYDAKYPDGIPTSIVITTADGKKYDSGLVMYPAGHARNTTADVKDILAHKFRLLGELATADADAIIQRFNNLPNLSPQQLDSLYDFEIQMRSAR
jgi:2-methylcitrate dehydratase